MAKGGESIVKVGNRVCAAGIELAIKGPRKIMGDVVESRGISLIKPSITNV
jgi:hypothetical protein